MRSAFHKIIVTIHDIVNVLCSLKRPKTLKVLIVSKLIAAMLSMILSQQNNGNCLNKNKKTRYMQMPSPLISM